MSSSSSSCKEESQTTSDQNSYPSTLNNLKTFGKFLFYAPIIGVNSAIRRMRHGPLYEHLYQYVTENAQEGDPASVVQALDRFAAQEYVMMFVGDVKGPIVRNIVEKLKPMVCLEIGSMIGYSAIDAARALPQGALYYCIEPDGERIEVLRKLVDYAGLKETIHAIQGYSTEIIPKLKAEYGIEAADYVFIDHYAPLYKPDLVLLEDQGLLKPGTVVVADNVILTSTVEYLDYVRNSPKYQTEFIAGSVGYNFNIRDGLEKSVFVG